MAKITSKIPALNNLKQCLQFLEWLKNDEHMQGQVAEELARRLRIYYSKNSDAQNIKTALSRLLFQVSHFYDKLCKDAQPTNYMENTPSVVLFTLLACIPKLLSVVYFLQYHVDKRFVAVGGGDWADQTIGLVAMSTSGVSKIDTYLIDTSFVKYGVISGGFEKGELKEGKNGGYTYGGEMVDNLPKLLEELHTNFFSDVFVTSALTNAGSQASNTANALALLKTFCEIVDNDKDNKVENALDGYINEYGNCIDWEQLKPHCAILKKSLEKIFNAGILSNTGHSPAVDDLNKEKFAKRMTRWLKENLDRVGSSLKEIKANRYTGAGEYFNKHFFPYGFIFDERNLGTESNGSENLDQKWKGVIGMLGGYGGELDALVHILKGRKCDQTHGHHTSPQEADAEDQYDDVVELVEDGTLVDAASSGSPNQNNGQSEQKPEISQAPLGSDTPPEDGKGQGPSGSGDGGKSLQVSDPPAQQLVQPPAAAHTSSTSTPSPGHPSPGGHGPGGGTGAPGSNGDPGQLGPTGPVASASSHLPDAQGIQPPPPTLQSSAMSTPTPPASPAVSPKLPAQAAVLGAGSDSASLGTQNTVSPQAVRNQAAKVSTPRSAASGSLAPGSGRGQHLPELEVEVLKPKLIHSRGVYKPSADALFNYDIEKSRYGKGITPPKYPLTGPQTFGKPHSQSDLAYNRDKLREASGLSNALGLHDADVPFERFDFHESPNEGITSEAYIPQCREPWFVEPSSLTTISATRSPPPPSDHLPPPQTIREMLYWLVGLTQYSYIYIIEKHVKSILNEQNNDVLYPSQHSDAVEVIGDPSTLDASHVTAKVTEACHYAAVVIYRIEDKGISNAMSIPEFNAEYRNYYYSLDPAGLLCQLRDYVYACHHQLEFLKSQCSRDKSHGGWVTCQYGQSVSADSPLQAFLTDASNYNTYFYNPCDVCLKSRIRMGFRKGYFGKSPKDASYLYYLLSPTCSVDDDPLLTLSAYLNCLTRRTPRTTGELVSFFHHFGNELYLSHSKGPSNLGTALSTPHPNCPDWDHLGRHDLHAVRGIRGTDAFNTIHDNAHPRTLSTLVGCSGDRANCPQHCSPITYRAYSLYSPTFAHTYLIWAVYLPDRLWESLKKLRYDLEGHGNTKCASLHSCPYAMPLLYLHGFTPPEGTPQTSLKCSDVISKLEKIVNGQPIASLMTRMDDFLYKVRMPFIYTLIALWSAAALLLSYTILYRLDILYLCSHAIRSKASHLIDVKALLTNSRKMLSLYDADYFDDDPNDLIDQLK
ncbi:hypothetical protein BBBOND_0300550 [Babesia bigemina]|uniref:Ribosome binding protein n=1 Tax=Babesia bigemina TaxID=5866 RepID=A0A061DDC3_BABBI|nr:hypothetical protein BBBOND_0300550 [Babesia bigemina]CDR96150.1 hypothetical protein BBBOND_0300550 [Babesia bigemina]|eukprot:XP_012768336.1 hypothetical protein BBBOND_0300550 [Babesia bigemina]